MKNLLKIVIFTLILLLHGTNCMCGEIFLVEDICVFQEDTEHNISRSVSRIIDPQLGIICYEEARSTEIPMVAIANALTVFPPNMRVVVNCDRGEVYTSLNNKESE